MASNEDSQASIRCIKVLMNTFNTHLMDITPETPKQHKALKQAIEAMAKFEYGELKRLEEVFK